MDNQDLTLERRLQAKDELIAELLEALEKLDRANKKGFIHLNTFYKVPSEAIRKAKGE